MKIIKAEVKDNHKVISTGAVEKNFKKSFILQILINKLRIKIL